MSRRSRPRNLFLILLVRVSYSDSVQASRAVDVLLYKIGTDCVAWATPEELPARFYPANSTFQTNLQDAEDA